YKALYVGMHVGCGYGYKVSEKMKVEGYGRYTCTWQEGKEIRLARNEKIKFEGVMSNRIRVGVKGEYEGKVNPYIGVGLEEELGGEIKAKAEGKEIEKVSLEGVTMIGEVGVKMDISERLKLEVKGEGFVGKREGLLGMVKVKYAI
ncbi:MAG: autotransporter domain-containing protein, partial [Endomicrobium sp.]|nr:autotransporter domain-containing protein [Endomicrobium sp.]